MLTKSTKILSILLFAIFIYNYFGYYFVFKVIQSGIKSKMEKVSYEMADSGDLVKFAFLRSNNLKENPNFQWVHDKEFIYEGEFYDIVKTGTRNDSIIYYCIHDNEETKLVDTFKDIHNNNSDDKRAAKHYELKLFQKDYLTKKNSYPAPHINPIYFKYKNHISYESIITDTLTPPPQLS